MTEFPHPWKMYALQQKRLARRAIVDDLTWGIEASLDDLCVGTISSDTDLERHVATASRRERYRASLQRSREREVQGAENWTALLNSTASV